MSLICPVSLPLPKVSSLEHSQLLLKRYIWISCEENTRAHRCYFLFRPIGMCAPWFARLRQLVSTGPREALLSERERPCSCFRSLWSLFSKRQGVPRATSKGLKVATKEKWKLEMIWADKERASLRAGHLFIYFHFFLFYHFQWPPINTKSPLELILYNTRTANTTNHRMTNSICRGRTLQDMLLLNSFLCYFIVKRVILARRESYSWIWNRKTGRLHMIKVTYDFLACI